MPSPLKDAGIGLSIERSTLSKAFTLTTAYKRPSISLVTTGTAPQYRQIRNCAVRVPNAYRATSSPFFTFTMRAPFGLEVQTPPCFVQNEQSQARAAIAVGDDGQSSSKEMLAQ